MARPVKQQEMPAWAAYLEDYFGVRLYGNKAERWLHWLGQPDSLGEVPDDYEILSALKFVREQGRGAGDRMTVDKLAMWIRWYRKTESAKRRGYDADTPEGRMAEIKYRMRQAETWAERWNILCGGNSSPVIGEGSRETRSLGECQELEAWAHTQWPEWDAEIEQVRSDMLARHAPGWEESEMVEELAEESVPF